MAAMTMLASFPNSSSPAGELAVKLKQLRQSKAVILHRNPARLAEFLRRLSDLQSDKSSPVRKLVAEMIGELGSKHMEALPEMIPCLLTFLKDEIPAVARQAIATGSSLFRKVLEKLVLYGLCSYDIDDLLESSWELMLNFKSLVLPIAFQATGNDGVRLLAVKFVESMVLLYTPDPSISSDPPHEINNDLGFNISWLRGGHPLLNAGDLAMEASQSLGLLLDQLKPPQVKSLTTSMVIVFINSVSAIAQRRPSFYGRILPVLLSLDSVTCSSIVKQVQLPGAFHALKNAFSGCLKCTHSSAEPWRARLIDALKAIDAGDSVEQTPKESGGKRSTTEEPTSGALNESSTQLGKRARLSPPAPGPQSTSSIESRIKNWEAVRQLATMFGALAAQGESAAGSLEILSASISSDLLAEVVMLNLLNLPPARPDGEVGPTQDLIVSSFWSSFPQLASLLKVTHQSSEDTVVSNEEPINTLSTEISQISSIPLDSVKPDSTIPGLIPGVADSANFQPVEIRESPEVSRTETQERLSSSADVSVSSASAVTVASSSQFVLPKMLVSNLELSDEARDQLQKEAFERIVESDEQLVVSGGARAQFPLVAHMGVEFPLELNPWEVLQKHVLSDYLIHEGHELTLRVLYRLYRETEQDQDFLSSRTATSVYDSFLVTVAETLRDTFPAGDKSLGRLLGDVPYLPEGVMKLLEGLCCPSTESNSNDKESQTGASSGDRVTQGLSAVWSLILLRPANRLRCLQIALQSAVHPLEDVRSKAIRLVANKLYPMASISQKIEEFATEKLHSVTGSATSMEIADIDELNKDGDSKGIAEAQCCMSLYFALCTKKHSLLRQIFAIYASIPHYAKQVVDRHIAILVRAIGVSRDLLEIISDPPAGSETLLSQVLQTLIEGTIPSSDLISSVKKLYSKNKDVEVLIPLIPYLPKDEILHIFPILVNLPSDKFQAAISRLLQGAPQSVSGLSPSEVLIAIHGIDPEKDGVPLKKVMDACSACFEQKSLFTQQVLAKALNQLVEQIPLPLLFMRTVIQAIGVFPGLVDFVMEIMSRLVSKQIWKYPKLWVGFVKCAIQTKPQSFSVLLQLPAPQLENALSKNPILRSPLVEHASQPNIRSTLPRSTLVVLGLVQDTQGTAGPTPTISQTQAGDMVNSSADVATESTQDSKSVS